jgi:hypothetical protein
MACSLFEREVPGMTGMSHLDELRPSQYSDLLDTKLMGGLSLQGAHGTNRPQGSGAGGLNGVGVELDVISSNCDCCVQSIWVRDSICVEIIWED